MQRRILLIRELLQFGENKHTPMCLPPIVAWYGVVVRASNL